MTRFLRDLRALGIALAAVVGVLLVPGAASAGTGVGTAPSCCVERAAAACHCCEDAAPAPLAAEAPRTDLRQATAPRVIPVRPCVCRPDRPSAPGRTPEPRTTVRPTDRASDVPAAGLAVVAPARHPFAIAPAPSGSTPDLPVYLRTARLLF
jgi:hypothetical protein